MIGRSAVYVSLFVPKVDNWDEPWKWDKHGLKREGVTIQEHRERARGFKSRYRSGDPRWEGSIYLWAMFLVYKEK